MGQAARGGIPTEMRITLQVRALPRDQTYPWNKGRCLRCLSLRRRCRSDEVGFVICQSVCYL